MPPFSIREFLDLDPNVTEESDLNNEKQFTHKTFNRCRKNDLRSDHFPLKFLPSTPTSVTI
jgi:hypothetical protein